MKNQVKRALILMLSPVLVVSALTAQTGSLKGFVFDSQTGSAVPLATVRINNATIGTSSDGFGFFSISRIPAGGHEVITSFIGYQDDTTKVNIREGSVAELVIHLTPKVFELGEAVINAERARQERINTAAVHRITPVTISKIPGFTGQADLAEFLQVLPGIIFTGDQGGQFYVRGGAPAHNLVKLDGMTVINPFHSIGFISVFDTDIIGTADVYTAGFGAAYGGRVSSVIDIRSKTGNRKGFHGNVGFSNFGYNAMMEGPIKKQTEKDPSSISFIVSNKGSYIDKTDDLFYPYLDSTGIPFQYNDFFGKVTLAGKRGDQLDFIGMHLDDRADYGALMKNRWQMNGGGVRMLITPRGTSSLFESSIYYSDYRADFEKQSQRPQSTGFNTFEFSFRVHKSTGLFDLTWGTELNTYNTIHSYVNLDGASGEDEFFSLEVVSFLHTKWDFPRWLIEPGLRFQYYADEVCLSPEPRLKIKYRMARDWSINFASGLYSQNLISASSPEDVVSLFQAYYISPYFMTKEFRGQYFDKRLQFAWHTVLGATWMSKKNMKITLEGYVKDFYWLINTNRHKVYPDLVFMDTGIAGIYRKQFILEKGWGYGVDFLLDWTQRQFNVWLGYSLGWVTRQDELEDYLPHFDRRHNLNVLAGYSFGHLRSWDFKIRWNLGTGFPFTQTNGIFEDFDLVTSSLLMDPTANSNIGIWYGAYNQGRLPWYHRLDISIHKIWKLSGDLQIEAHAGVINVYNRHNIFYFDRTRYDRVDQFPILPNFGVKVGF